MNYIDYKHEPKKAIVKLCGDCEGTADILIGVILAHLPLEKIIDAQKYIQYGTPIKWEVRTP